MVIIVMNELSERKKDYVEAIYNLRKRHDCARISDLAETLDVKLPSVTNMLQKLDHQRLVRYTPSKGATLTPKGKLIAETSAKRHQAVRKFLIMMGISKEQAEKDACKMKHKLDKETAGRLADLVDFIESAPQIPPILKHFKHYYNTGKRPIQCCAKGRAQNSQALRHASTRRQTITNEG